MVGDRRMTVKTSRAEPVGGQTATLNARILRSITEVREVDWDSLLPPGTSPFVRWAWLHALEASGSAVPARGWEAAHLALGRGDRLVAAAPAWIKSHSMGEYIYDFGWANAARRMGIEYYPKLLVGVPLGPVTTPKLLVAPGEDAPRLREALAAGLLDLARERACSSVHFLFLPEDEAAFLEELGLTRRLTLQFHWRNRGYASWDEFLSRFNSKRRHQLRRERAAAAEQGIQIETVRGAALHRSHADRAFQFYEHTNEKNAWGHVQLTRDFFRRVFASFPDEVELVEARRGRTVIAGAFNVASGERLFGRYWGGFEEVPFLHFHVCLYHSIDESIRLGRRAFEPGAGGEHKIARGFEPSPIHSAHLLFDGRLQRAVAAFCDDERRENEALIGRGEEIAGLRPWRGGDGAR